jgi:hypothetical protein
MNGNSQISQSVLQGKAVHHSGQHSHMIGPGAIHTLRGSATEDIAAADNNSNLNAQFQRFPDFTGNPLNHFRVNTKQTLPHQGFATQFQENAFVGKRTHLVVSNLFQFFTKLEAHETP